MTRMRAESLTVPTPEVSRTTPRLRAGLCSVTFRHLTPAQVLDVAAASQLAIIEWGADVHVPSGDLNRAAAVADATAAAGLTVPSYGSYLRLGAADTEENTDVIATAVALGAHRIRVWAGLVGSAQATPEQIARVVSDARALANGAADHGLTIGLEFHGGTFTDTAPATVELLERIDRPSVIGTYWQPPEGMSDDDALAGLALVAEHVVAVHAFAWWPADQRHRLAYRASLWSKVAAHLVDHSAATDYLLEFLVDDDPRVLEVDAHTLRNILSRPRSDEQP